MTKSETITLESLIVYRSKVEALDRNQIIINTFVAWCLCCAISAFFLSLYGPAWQFDDVADILVMATQPYVCVMIILFESSKLNEKSDEIKKLLTNKLWRESKQGDEHLQANMMRLSVFASLQSDAISIPIVGISWTRESIFIQFITVVLSFLISYIAKEMNS